MDIKPNQNIIENEAGQLRSVTGPKGAEAFRLRQILIGMKLEATSPGMKLTRGPSCTAIAKALTGLKTRDREKLAVAVQAKLDEVLAQCLIVDEEDKQIP